jgi:hypothetical protein
MLKAGRNDRFIWTPHDQVMTCVKESFVRLRSGSPFQVPHCRVRTEWEIVMKWQTTGVIMLTTALSGCEALGTLGGAPSNGDVNGDGDSASGDGDAIDPELAAAAAKDPTICLPGVPGTSQLPRLTRVQYDNTVYDLLGVSGEPSLMLAPDSTGSVDQRAWDGYKQAAATVSAQVMADATARAKVITCAPTGDGTDCALTLIQDLGRRAFRRPLTAEETTRFGALVTARASITPSNSFDDLAQLIIEAYLLSPSFLTRAEIAEQPEGDYFALSGYEVASRLSYLLWDTMPDEALFAAAAAGELATSAGVLAQAERMLGDPKARGMVKSFHEHYLHMGAGTRWADITRDPALFPEYNDALSPLLSEETTRFVDHVVFDRQGTFQDLVTEPIAFVNADLAPLYDLDASLFGAELTPANLDATQRSGLFTRLGFLASHSYYDRSSPIHRGAFIQKHVLCGPIGTPPPGAEGAPLPTEGLTTNRERVDAQTGAEGCASCHHTHINPTGFAFESYNAVGAIQVAEAGSGAAINTVASVQVGDVLVDVDGPVALSEVIANAPEAQACYARKWVEYAYRRALNNKDSCVVDEMSDKLTEGGYTVLNLISDLTQSESFRYRVLEAEVGL